MNIRKFLNQDAVYWAPIGKNNYGEVTFDDPIDLKMRIVIRSVVRSTPVSDIVLPEATVLTADEVVSEGMIALGTVSGLDSGGLPEDNGGITIRSVLPFVDRRGNQVGFECTTAAQFTLGRAGSM